jgi:tight adherence protein B
MVSAYAAGACAALALAVAVVPERSGAGRLAALVEVTRPPGRLRTTPAAVAVAGGSLAGLLVLGPAGALAGAFLAGAWHRRHGRAAVLRSTSALATELADAVARIVEELRAGAHPAAALGGLAADGPLARAVLVPAATAAALGDGIPAALAAEAERRPAVAGDLLRISRTWALAERHGIPPADLLAGVLDDMRLRTASAGRTRAQLAGPRATAAVLTALPGLGIALGELIGAAPLTVLRSGILGQLLVVVGVGLAGAGAAWAHRITRAAAPR